MNEFIIKFQNGEGFREEDESIAYFEQENGYPVRVIKWSDDDYSIEEVPFVGY